MEKSFFGEVINVLSLAETAEFAAAVAAKALACQGEHRDLEKGRRLKEGNEGQRADSGRLIK